ncbi:zinc-binding dehydrogenase [Pontivivens ytuae]|uniref:Zinc-binding dehydrogenase n=1 Tax=Pontivivens ytuae TaxID=2789856 RepID=A0A7S9LNY6_9RHOB|nr:zinc-binding dehydrogenase [Pontivivens ytuae]QPH52609.1 zinc-binding dehydrogenase [Pontivivens ytuae]
MKTRAAILVETGRPLEVAEIGIPALKPGQVLVEVNYSGACGTQVMEWRGEKGEDKWVPHCLGHEGTGVVLETGSAVTKVQQDDRVVLSWIRGVGQEAGGAVYDWAGRKVNAGGVTTFQKLAIVSENRLTKVPVGLSQELGVLLGCAAPTGMGAVFNVLKARPGDSVAVFGTGGVGLNAVMAAAFSGATPVIGIDPSPARRELAITYGATHVLDPSESDVVEAIREIVPGGVDLAAEASGQPAVMKQALQTTRAQGGRAVVIGNAKAGNALSLDPGLFNQGKSLLGTWGGDSVPDRDYARFGKLIASDRFPVQDLLSAPYALSQINEALTDLAAGTIGRPLIDMSLD